MSELNMMAASPDPAWLDLPWDQPLTDWPAERLAALPRGISRHVVRFAVVSGRVVAIKETEPQIALREYELLRTLRRTGLPAVKPLGVVTGRVTTHGEPLPAALMTRHLKFSLPYRALFSHTLREETATRLVDALTVLLVRLHLAGFYWGDVSLSNTLFRRDAGALAAYLVDAETGALHAQLSPGQRKYDVDIACTNIAGELMDLQAGGFLADGYDPIALAQTLSQRYTSLWQELTAAESFGNHERWRIQDRIGRLNALGFDVGELTLSTYNADIRIEPKVVEAGHHSRRMLRLTGLDVEENQARQLLNDLDTMIATSDLGDLSEEMAAHQWLTTWFEPMMRAVPPELRGKLEAAELYYEVLVHRWYLSEQRGQDVGRDEALRSYVDTILPAKPDESEILGIRTGAIPIIRVNGQP